MSVEEKRPLPKGWEWKKINQLADLIQYGHTESAKYEPVGPKFLRITDIQDGRVNWETVPFCRSDEKESRKYALEDGDIVFARTGATTGKSFLITNPPDAVFASYLIRLRFPPSTNSKYLSYYFQTPTYWSHIMTVRKGSAQPGVNATKLAELDVPLAPLPLQERIVSEIEKQFTRLDQAVASLKRAQANLQRYKASVLKAACEGRLVPQDPNDEPAEKLLQSILTERRRQWEQQEWQKLVIKAQKKIVQSRRKAVSRPARLTDLQPEEWEDLAELEYVRYLPKNDRWKEKYKEPVGVETAELPELPNGWVWSSLENLLNDIQTGPFGSSLHKSDYVIDGIPVINPASLIDGRISPIKRMSIDKDTRERLSRFILESGDVIMGRRGEMGRSASVTEREDGWLCGTGSLILRFAQPINRQFIVYLFSSGPVKAYLSNASVGTTMQNLNQKILLNMVIGLPPRAEQERIVAEVERRLSVVAANEKAIAADLARAKRLRQSILQQAFSGQLVARPQRSSETSEV